MATGRLEDLMIARQDRTSGLYLGMRLAKAKTGQRVLSDCFHCQGSFGGRTEANANNQRQKLLKRWREKVECKEFA